VTYTPPSPTEVDWRLGQNPGVADPVRNGGHPEDLAASIDLLIDHNGVYVNWMLIHSANEQIFRFLSLENLTGESCSATVRRMDGTDASTETIHDPDGLFDGMQSGTYGRAFYQDGKYWILQAKCFPG